MKTWKDRFRLIIPAGIMACSAGLMGFAASNVSLSLVGFWPPDKHGLGIYGIAAAGNYAYYTDQALHVLHVHNPGQPRLISELAVGSQSSIAISGNHLYVVDGPMLSIVDISEPMAPVAVGDFPLLKPSGNVTISEERAYIAEGDSVEVLDLTDPLNPWRITRWTGFATSTGDGLPSGTCVAAASGNYAFLAEAYDGMVVLDITDVTKPQEVARYKGSAKAVYWGLAIDDGYAYLPDFPFTGLQVADVTDPTGIQWAGEIGLSSAAGQVAVAGGYVYMANDLIAIYRAVEVPSQVPAITGFAPGRAAKSFWVGWNPAAAGMKLQKCESLADSGWRDVDGSELLSHAEVSVGSGQSFFRLAKP